MGFRQPNRTKTLFQQIDANKPQAARQKLGAAMGAQSVLTNQTQAQGQENQNVQQAQQGVTQQTAQGQQAISGTPMLTVAQGAVNTANTSAGQTPVFANSVQGNTGGFVNNNGKVFNNTALTESGRRTMDANAKVLADTKNAIAGARGALGNFSADKLSTEVGNIYGTESDKLAQSEKQMTEQNLGQLADESAFEQEQADLAQVLADRNSNIGKLKSLYGVGYDTGKYGALDSNLLQGQFNDLAGESATNLDNREKTRATGDRVRESYLDNIDTSRQALDKTKGETDKQITKLNDDISAAQIKLNELEAKTDQASKTAATKLREDLDRKIVEKRKIAENASKTIEGRSSDAFAAGGRGLSDYFQKNSNPKEIQLIADIGTAIGTGKGNTPKEVGSMLTQLSPDAIKSISVENSRLSSASVDWAAANTKNPTLKKQLELLSSKLASRGSAEKRAADEAARRDAERKKHVKTNQDTNKNLATGGVYGLGKKVGLWE